MNQTRINVRNSAEPDSAGLRMHGARAAAVESLPPRLTAVLGGLGSADARGAISPIIAKSFKLARVVSTLRATLERQATTLDVRPLLEAVRRECRYLGTAVETADLTADDLTAGLREALDSVGFALGHESRRAFAEWDDGGPAESPRGAAVRTCALVENCLRQSLITLARACDPTVCAADLFDDHEQRREQSLLVYEELIMLLGVVRKAESSGADAAPAALLDSVRRFRYEHLHLLMYRDWESFERFGDEFEMCGAGEEYAALLHRFARYIETLLAQVRLRADLVEP